MTPNTTPENQNNHVRSEAGAGMAEYTLLLLLIAVPLALIFPSLAAAIAAALGRAAAAF